MTFENHFRYIYFDIAEQLKKNVLRNINSSLLVIKYRVKTYIYIYIITDINSILLIKL